MIFDLSRAVTGEPPCSFTPMDRHPALSFKEGGSHGIHFLTSEIAHLASNLCTHIDFPGHLASLPGPHRQVGAYELERFVGDVAVLDFTAKLDAVDPYFDSHGHLTISPRQSGEMLSFLRALDDLEVRLDDLQDALARADATLDELSGLLFYSGVGRHWTYNTFDSWSYAYFYSPFMSSEACDAVVDAGLSFVGIDAFQLEHPLINFSGDALPLVLSPECRDYVSDKLSELSPFPNHQKLLSSDVLIYENLDIPPSLGDRTVQFSGVPLNLQLPELTDNALARPYAVTGS